MAAPGRVRDGDQLMGLYNPPPSPGTPPPPLFGPAERNLSPYMQAWLLPMDALGSISGLTSKVKQMQAGVPGGTPGVRAPIGNIGGGASRVR